MNEPVYACSLDDQELAVRRAGWRALERRALVRTEARPDGRLLVFRGGEDTGRALRALIEAERECCPFLDFSVDRSKDEVVVSLRDPSGALLSGP